MIRLLTLSVAPNVKASFQAALSVNRSVILCGPVPQHVTVLQTRSTTPRSRIELPHVVFEVADRHSIRDASRIKCYLVARRIFSLLFVGVSHSILLMMS